jgi:hypothetical protein
MALHDAMLACYRDGDLSRDAEILRAVSADAFAENDLRFLHYALLEYFKRCLGRRPEWKQVNWHSSKNMSGGVWLANYDGPQGPKGYEFSRDMRALDASGQFYFHVQLRSGIAASPWEAPAGELQLRCQSGTKPPAKVVAGLKEIYTADKSQGETWSSRKKSAGSYYVLKRDLRKEDLVFTRLEAALKSLMGCFGRFVCAR